MLAILYHIKKTIINNKMVFLHKLLSEWVLYLLFVLMFLCLVKHLIPTISSLDTAKIHGIIKDRVEEAQVDKED